MDSAADIAKRALTHKTPERVLQNSDFLSMGLTLGNLSAYGRTHGGLVKGFIYRLIGKSQTAKSILAKTILAEASISPSFEDYELLYDDIERGGQLLKTTKFFGAILASRMSAPAYEKGTHRPLFTRTLPDFYRRVSDRLNKGKKFIWVPDSLDSLDSDVNKMSDGKAKEHAQQLRKLITGMHDTGSIMLLVQHAKKNMGSIFEEVITTGGVSPEYYSTLDIWLSKMGPIKKGLGKEFNSLEEQIGVKIKCHIKKNRVNGTDREFVFPLYYQYGIDDIGACVDWLVYVGYWKKADNGVITAPEFKTSGSASKIIRHIEEQNAKKELQITTGKVWKLIEDKLDLKRKPRYA